MGIHEKTGIVYVGNHDWINILKKLENNKIITAQAADNALATIGAEGRKLLTDKEERTFDFGRIQYKNGEAKPRSIFDAKMGGWKSLHGEKLIGYKFDSAAYSRRRMMKFKLVSEGHIYSRISNLWDKPTKRYKESSQQVGQPGFITRWKKGWRRPSRPVWSASDINSVVAPAMNRVGTEMIQRLQKEMDKQ